MIRFLARRLLLGVLVMVGVTSVTFLTMTVAAGDYIPGLDLETALRAEDLQRLREQLGLDRPLYVQYLSWLAGLARLDLGASMIDRTPVIEAIMARLPNTLLLSMAAFVIGIPFGVLAGVVSAVNRNKPIDKALSAVAVMGYAVPQFWLGLMLILVFSLGLRSLGLPALPSGGSYDVVSGGDLLDRLAHLVLPAITLSFFYLSIWSRFVRSSMLAILSQDYVRTARGKGLGERDVVVGHALRNALGPLATLIGLELPRLVSGALVVEVIFAWPGIGRFMWQQAMQYDYTSVLGVTTFVSIVVVLGSIFADALYRMIDPRVEVA